MTADENVLPEQRERLTTRRSRVDIEHIALWSTSRAWSSPDVMWTRRAADVRNLCGSMSYVIVGASLDAAKWPSKAEAIDITSVTCAHCRARYDGWVERGRVT